MKPSPPPEEARRTPAWFLRPPLLLAVLVLVALFCTQRCTGKREEDLSRSRIIMGTVVEITVLGKTAGEASAAIDEAFAVMARIEALMTPHDPASDVARLSGALSALEVSAETAEVVALGERVAAASDGAFDMALGRLKELWGVEGEAPRVPTSAEIDAALEGTGVGDLIRDGQTIVKRSPDLAVDLGGIAKGYAVDRAAAVLRRAGVKSAAINAGGDIRLLGDRNGRPWRIGIQHPREDGRLLATLSLGPTAVVTSGDYERYFEVGGVRYHHLFDPATGYPSRRCQSVTVVAESAALADALATAAFVLGPEGGLRLLEKFPGAEVILVAADGSRHVSPGLQGAVTWP
ncbi:thiamine biosynthesis lipoprotein ApbE [Desulfuromonas soudanensis]|uniref:FAD:protein FMN transferase n=1 Tax=Desulfuromonas soudanensis TaxID=1603606 RepID=A0A0M4D9Q2_9BACT|nr:FAD:protein FMN transferase [Desulfuromonas soudanensis]ALC18260.1 thiamine biosynthesis lipoprotein ApbE [Desulfuromonas soudanensis]